MSKFVAHKQIQGTTIKIVKITYGFMMALMNVIFALSMLGMLNGCTPDEKLSITSSLDAKVTTEKSRFSQLSSIESNDRDFKTFTDLALYWNEWLRGNAVRFDKVDGEMTMLTTEAIADVMGDFLDALDETGFMDAASWVGEPPPKSFFDGETFTTTDANPLAETQTFAKKVTVTPKTKMIVMGDFHGSMHALFRNLWRLYANGIIDRDFNIINNDYHLVFTGDYLDRGRYGLETIFIVLKLAANNPARVHALRGNHELGSMAATHGFLTELKAKFGDDGLPVFNKITELFRFFPVVLYADFKTPTKSNVIHFSHGGFGYNYKTNRFLYDPVLLLKGKKNLEYLKAPAQEGFMWSDFSQSAKTENSPRWPDESGKDGVATIGLDVLKKYLANYGIRAIIRGHQDMDYNVKLLFKNASDAEKLEESKRPTNYKENGPFNWRDVVVLSNKTAEIGGDLKIDSYAPVFTLTTAVEGRKILSDSYVILSFDPEHDFTLSVKEFPVTIAGAGAYFYSNISKVDTTARSIFVDWNDSGPGICKLD